MHEGCGSREPLALSTGVDGSSGVEEGFCFLRLLSDILRWYVFPMKAILQT